MLDRQGYYMGGMDLATMDVSTSTLAAAVQGVRALISAYDGYEKGRFMKSDEAVRALSPIHI